MLAFARFILDFSKQPDIDQAEMASFETYQSNAAEAPVMRKWFLRALILSLVFHLALFIWFKCTELQRFSTTTDRLVPRAFRVNRLVIDAKLLDETEDSAPPPPVKAPVKNVPNVQLPTEQPQFEQLMKEVRTKPDAVEPSKTILNEKPRVDASTVQTISKLQENASKNLERELDSFKDQLLNDKPTVASGPTLNINDSTAQKLPAGNTDAAALAAAAGRLDQMLGNGLSGKDAPLQLPGGALFEFDKADLNTDAIKLLEKRMTLLIQKNPKVTIEIEGYTDSFGSPAHNLDLSTRRAESVKAWILQRLAVGNIPLDPSHIQAKGFGSSHFRVEPEAPLDGSQAAIDAEIARQQPNRRVEIVFHFPAGE
jgi:outer membrane protein OmpA-like peptidoglycan-associated protein